MPIKIHFEKHTLPAHWASYIVNGDPSGLDDYDIEECERYLHELENPLILSSEEDNEPFFAFRNDANTLGCDCLIYKEMIRTVEE